MTDEVKEMTDEVKEPKVQLIPVEIVSTEGKTSLVKYLVDDVLYQVYIPTTKITNGEVDVRTLSKGLPYGLPWDQIKLPDITGKALATALHNQGIWTAEECRSNPQGMRAAIMQLYSGIFLSLTEFIREEKSKGGK